MARSRKPQVVKMAVVAKSALGVSKAQTARELGISHDTMRRILSESELASLVDEGRRSLYECIPEAAQVLASKGYPKAQKILEHLNRAEKSEK